MRTVITGGAGFLGARLAAHLLAAPDAHGDDATTRRVVVADVVVPVHTMPSPHDRLEICEVDLTGPGPAIDEVVAGADAVVHLASVVSADAEADPAKAWALNVEGSRRLLEACARTAPGCRFLAASSVAVFAAEPGGAPSGDRTKLQPRSTYGMTKAVLELLVDEATRRGVVDGRVARLPTVVVRPGRPNLAASSFASGVFREPFAGIDVVVPVRAEVGIVLIGHRAAVAGLAALLAVPADRLAPARAVNLPGLCTTVEQMIAACRSVGARRGLTLGAIEVRPDPAVEAIVASWPSAWAADQALALGVAGDASLEQIAEDYLEDFGS